MRVEAYENSLHEGIPPHVPGAAVVSRVVVGKVGVDYSVGPAKQRK